MNNIHSIKEDNMKSIIIYESHHHNNTEKVVKKIAEEYDVDLFIIRLKTLQ